MNGKPCRELMDEALEKHRKVKQMMLTLMEQSSKPNMTKDKMREELFKIFMELK